MAGLPCGGTEVHRPRRHRGGLFGWLIDRTGNWNVPFASGVAILLAGAVAVALLRPDVPLVIPQSNDSAPR